MPVRWTRHAGHWWRNENELISIGPLWNSTYGHTSVGRPVETGCRLVDLSSAMADRDGWWERERERKKERKKERERFKGNRVLGQHWWR